MGLVGSCVVVDWARTAGVAASGSATRAVSTRRTIVPQRRTSCFDRPWVQTFEEGVAACGQRARGLAEKVEDRPGRGIHAIGQLARRRDADAIRAASLRRRDMADHPYDVLEMRDPALGRVADPEDDLALLRRNGSVAPPLGPGDEVGWTRPPARRSRPASTWAAITASRAASRDRSSGHG
jgi:hypothetical protein